MIVVKIELWSARTRTKKLIGMTVISNDGTLLHAKRGNYDVAVANRASLRGEHETLTAAKAVENPVRRGRVEDFPKESYNIWRLVIRALRSAFPEEK